MTTRYFSSIVLLLTLAAAVVAQPPKECVYALNVQTGTMLKAGTDSKISVTLSDRLGKSVWIPDLKEWGLMGKGYDYFERGNLDVFSGRGQCISTPICRLNVTSDGSGRQAGWYCEYVEVTSVASQKPCSQTMFSVNQWLATDSPPYQLTAILDGCKKMAQLEEGRKGPFVVGKVVSSASEKFSYES